MNKIEAVKKYRAQGGMIVFTWNHDGKQTRYTWQNPALHKDALGRLYEITSGTRLAEGFTYQPERAYAAFSLNVVDVTDEEAQHLIKHFEEHEYVSGVLASFKAVMLMAPPAPPGRVVDDLKASIKRLTRRCLTWMFG